jgi:hypothetical protein
MVGFGVTCVEPSGSTARELISKLDLREIGSEDERWMGVAQDRVQWLAFVSAMLNLRVLLP